MTPTTGKAQIGNTLSKSHPRTWKRATKDQRREIVAKYEATGSVRKAFAGVRFSRISLSDLTFDSVGAMTLGGSR